MGITRKLRRKLVWVGGFRNHSILPFSRSEVGRENPSRTGCLESFSLPPAPCTEGGMVSLLQVTEGCCVIGPLEALCSDTTACRLWKRRVGNRRPEEVLRELAPEKAALEAGRVPSPGQLQETPPTGMWLDCFTSHNPLTALSFPNKDPVL